MIFHTEEHGSLFRILGTIAGVRFSFYFRAFTAKNFSKRSFFLIFLLTETGLHDILIMVNYIFYRKIYGKKYKKRASPPEAARPILAHTAPQDLSEQFPME
jgi:hypothetical protein